MKFKISRLIATFFYTGLSRVCPGTVGSICTLPLWFIIITIISGLSLNPILSTIFTILFIYIIGHITTKVYIEETNKEDPGEVVIDEVVGQLLAFSFSFCFVFFTKDFSVDIIKNNATLFSLYSFIMPIILFRIYDIKKPWIIGIIDKKVKGATGIMLDDVVGGIFAGITNSLLMLIILQVI